MNWIVKLVQKKFSDFSILSTRTIIGLLYIGLMYYNLIYLGKDIDRSFLFGLFTLKEENVLIAKYIMTCLGIIPLLLGVTNLCLLKKKYVRIIQIILGILIFYVASCIKTLGRADFDIIIGIMGFIPLFAGLTGKCITKKCLKYGEKIKKIRV